MKTFDLFKIIKDCNFESLIEDVSHLYYSYNGINEDVDFYEEIKYKDYDIEINGKANVCINGKTQIYHDSPPEFWATDKNVYIEFGEINVWKKGFIIDAKFDNETKAAELLTNYIKTYL